MEKRKIAFLGIVLLVLGIFILSNNFILARKYDLTTKTLGKGTLKISPEQDKYKKGTKIKLTAKPSNQWNFSHWSGDLKGSEISKEIIINKNMVIRAHFKDKKEKVAENLLSKFKEHIEIIENNPSQHMRYDLVMASGYAQGILGVYKPYYTEEQLGWVSKKKEMIEYELGDFSTIYFGYSKAGLKFVALAAPMLSNNIHFRDAANKIRKNKKESKLFEDLFFKANYYAIDVYIEDLFERREEFEIDIFVERNRLRKEQEEILRPVNDLKEEEVKKILSKYNRESKDNNDIVKNKSWNLYLFKKRAGWPNIRIKYNGETIILSDE